ncbi:hypothetical protein KAU40_00975 [Candidatus Parcubacteria bacterium]|nr:hypothetical protein [Candidatus Parcubacteria bacterium]
MTDHLERYKEEGDPLIYRACKNCGSSDGTSTLNDFGLCLKCIEEFEAKIPENVRVSLGRVLLWRSEIHRPEGLTGGLKKITK